jgi:acetyl-CoA carboxylase biotin carboxyl carrier protein
MQEPVELARELARIARENQLAEIEYREDNTVLRLIFEPKKKIVAAAPVAMVGAASVAPASSAAPAAAEAAPAPAAPVGLTINSPLAGVFYRAPRPGAPPFVEAGNSVSTGDTLCIVEAMKLMNEIAAEGPLRILRVLAENAQVVDAGQPLFEYEPLS